MNIELTYLLDGKVSSTSKTNHDLVIVDQTVGVKTRIIVKANQDLIIQAAHVDIEREYNDSDSLFCNGYQTWTDTKEFGINDKMNSLKQVPPMVQKKFSFRSYGDVAFYEYKKNVLHAHDVAYIRGLNNIFIGNNNYHYAGLIIEFHTKANIIRLISDINNIRVKEGEAVVLFDYEIQPFKELEEITYFDKFKPRTTKKIFGYSSWYNHFDKVNEEIILKNVEALDERFNLFQIDDGYETFVGDWMDIDSVKFPNGLGQIVEKIHAKNAMAGIWIAPFVAAEGSKLMLDHPDWLKYEDDKPVKCGCNWNGFYALDFNKKEVKEYIKECLKFYSDLGFDFFKLDFLYAVSLPKYGGKNRSEIASEAYQFLRDCIPDKLILGNGAVMAPAFGVFDYMRIGCDVSLEWDDAWFMHHMHRERISTKIAIQDAIYRSIFNNRVFLNDPDVFLLRDENMSMTTDQRYSLCIINSLFGSVLMTSDDISNYDEKKKERLDMMFELFNHAKKIRYRKRGDLIDISYYLNGKAYEYTYDTNSGLLREVEDSTRGY